jgi:predicted molibdopterin-dependent oxidoreductase YjgC
VLGRIAPAVHEYADFLKAIGDADIDALIVTGNYGGEWADADLLAAAGEVGERFVLLIDTLPSALAERADVLLPGATWAEKAGTFENVNGRLQAFERAIEPVDYGKSEAQIALDLIAAREGVKPSRYDAAATRRIMADEHDLVEFTTDVHVPPAAEAIESDMQMVEL